MSRMLVVFCALAFPVALSGQTAPDSISLAIAEGVKTGECPTVRLVPGVAGEYGKSNYAVSVDGPMLRVRCRAAGIARQHKPFERAMLTAMDTSTFYSVTAYPQGEIRPHLIANPSNVVLRVKADKADVIVAPDSMSFDSVGLKDGLGGLLVVPRVIAYFLPTRWPLVDFQIAVVTSGPEYRVKVGRSERVHIH